MADWSPGGRLLLGEINGLSTAAAKEAFEVRFWGAWLAAKHAHKHMRPGGSIVLSSGIAASRPQSGGSVVGPACGAVEALTRALAVELAPIRVNAVAAGMVRTPLWDDVPKTERNAVFDRARRSLPARRTGEAADIAKTHLHLMGEKFTTGTVSLFHRASRS
ncbi:SDR family oxidoreductase [Streptomonospora algeriensis]|uniref:SDR family oxidoreductase n=1 Tax=Streptomonospora algeriensis TaxID=995084 RepID=A0ABW3BAL6_9ACTN